jgi:membrane protein
MAQRITNDAQQTGDPQRTDDARQTDDPQRTDDAQEAKDVDLTAERKGEPTSPAKLGWRAWWSTLRRTVKQFQEDDLTDWAAALTYYGILSIFPGLLVLVSLLGLLSDAATNALLDNVAAISPGPVKDILNGGVRSLQEAGGKAGIFAIVGAVGALWSASGYIGAFMRAANAIYDVPEGRPIWKTLPIRVGITVLTGVLLAITALAVVFTGRLAEQVGKLIGVGKTAVLVWDIVKWPVLAVIVSLLFAILYSAAPNARQSGFRWITPGGVLAVLLWVAASAGFAFYVANFGSYNKTYGSLGAVIIFLVWLWISNLAVLLGAEFDAELERARAIAQGHPAEQEPYVPLRDDRKIHGKKQDADLG